MTQFINAYGKLCQSYLQAASGGAWNKPPDFQARVSSAVEAVN